MVFLQAYELNWLFGCAYENELIVGFGAGSPASINWRRAGGPFGPIRNEIILSLVPQYYYAISCSRDRAPVSGELRRQAFGR